MHNNKIRIFKSHPPNPNWNWVREAHQGLVSTQFYFQFLCFVFVRDGARFKYKLMGVMVIFYLRKNKHQSVLRTRFPEHRKLQHITGIHDIARCWAHNNYCTYLNSHVLEAPREYVLHGLVPGLNWAPFWPLPLSKHLVATPNPVSCCLLQRVGFHT